MTTTNSGEGRNRAFAPISTYRVQFRNGTDFAAVAQLAPYLASLGVSHLYSSPYLEAAAGSAHGYDVVNPAHVDPALGGDEGLASMRQALRGEGLGEILDVVPNHLAISGPENPWWWDVLENGPASRYARVFDVDWESGESYLRNKILLPILGDHYGRILEAGEVRLERTGATFAIRYFEHSIPVEPRALDNVVQRAARDLETERPGDGRTNEAVRDLDFIADSLASLPPSTTADYEASRRRHRHKLVLQRLLGDLLEREPAARDALDAAIEETNANPELLHELLERQNYRLAFWRAAGRELGYRRFFDVTTLVGVRQEDEMVFDATHPLVGEWLRSGALDGVRVDHPDGLRDPKQYLERLRRFSPRAWVVVEKILEPGERLREDWPVAGTTGYDFMYLTNNLFVDRSNEAAMTRVYADFAGETRTYPEIGLDAKRLILREVLATELARLAGLLLEICELHPRFRDYTRHDLHEALLEVAACFPIYRTYVEPARAAASPDQGTPIEGSDRRAIEDAIDLAERERSTIDPRLLDFIHDILTLEVAGELEGEFVARFQQLTGPVMAKGIEDTAFYRFVRLTSLNEVGGDPGVFGIGLDAFHRANEERQAVWPGTMLSSSTHDTKRSEDVRARIALLSEIPDRWAETVARLAELAAPHKTAGMPDRNTEWLYYQTLVGAWPLPVDRATAYMEKATREAKSATSWAAPNEAFDSALRRFVEETLADETFTDEVAALVASLRRAGEVTSLAQTLLKLTSPGVPDLYQGTELWDLSLVDPDNRRPVDFELRRRLLAELHDCEPGEGLGIVERSWAEGAPKLWLIRRTLAVRNRLRESFGSGSRGGYVAIAARGPQADRVVAFSRGGNVLAVAPRLVLTLEDWADTSLPLPAGRWRDELSGAAFDGAAPVELGRLLARFPVALLVRDEAEA